MNIPSEIFKSYDIRGIYPKQLNEENIVLITKAIYKLFQQKLNKKNALTVAVGRDMRLSSPALFDSLSKTLISLGAEVIDLGLVSTPSVYFSVFKYGYDGGIQITASHNLKDYNGLKLVINSPDGLIKIGKNSGMDDIKQMAINGVEFKNDTKGKITKKENILDDEVENALQIAGNPTILQHKIVVDAANAMGALFIEALFKKIPVHLIKMNFKLDGTFPAHQADPLQPHTLVDLQKKVIDEKADFGIALDGDGDRIFFIDDQGKIAPPPIITALVAKEILNRNKGEKIIADIRYILTPRKIIEESEGIFIISRVGHAFISAQMSQEKAIFAGESSGHFYFKQTGYAESSMPIILFVLNVLSREKKKLSQITADLRRSHESGEINFEIKNANELIDILKKEYSDGEVDTTDGIAISYPDWRFSVRTSNTEPLLRLNIEAERAEIIQDKKEHIVALIEKHSKN